MCNQLYSIGPNFYVNVPDLWYLNLENDTKKRKKIKASHNIPEQVSLNRKIFSEKRGRVLKTK